MTNNLSRPLTLALSLFFLGLFLFRPVLARDVPKMTTEELNSILDHPDVIVIDVRFSKNWRESDIKIKGATRGNPKDFKSWAEQHPKDKTLVLY